MTDTTTDPLPPLRPREKHTYLAIDTFCVECGYNLQSQVVTRDERLGIFICRCPECGRFHPAGVGITAASLWTQRLATILLFFWVLIVLFAIFWIIMGMGAVMVAHVEIFSYRWMVDVATGKEVEFLQTTNPNTRNWQPVIKGTTRPSANWVPAFTRDLPQGRAPYTFWDYFPLPLAAAGIGFTTGLLLVCFFWHWKKRRYVLTLLLPLGCAGFVSVVYVSDDSYMFIRDWAIRLAFGYALLEIAFMVLGILVGRPIVRGLLRMFIPPRPRQHFAFLWRCDGKDMAIAPVT